MAKTPHWHGRAQQRSQQGQWWWWPPQQTYETVVPTVVLSPNRPNTDNIIRSRLDFGTITYLAVSANIYKVVTDYVSACRFLAYLSVVVTTPARRGVRHARSCDPKNTAHPRCVWRNWTNVSFRYLCSNCGKHQVTDLWTRRLLRRP